MRQWLKRLLDDWMEKPCWRYQYRNGGWSEWVERHVAYHLARDASLCTGRVQYRPSPRPLPHNRVTEEVV